MNLTKIKTTDLEGNEMIYDVSKTLGNIIYQSTGDLGMLEVAQQMYKTGEIELTDEQKMEIVALLQDKRCPLIAIVKQALLTELIT